MAKKLDKDISGSVQEKRGMLYLVVSYKDPITQKHKTKWVGMGVPSGSPKSVINKAEREAKNQFEAQYKRYLDGYDDPTQYPLLEFLNDWLDKVHKHKIQESTYYGYKSRVNGKMKKYFDTKITLADCKPRLIHGFYDYLREDGDSEQTVLHYHNLLHTAFEYAIRQEILEYNPMDRVERPQVKKFVGAFYSVDEVKVLLEKAKEDVIYIPIVLAVYCGLRRSEALGLSWSNIDFENDTCMPVVNGKSSISGYSGAAVKPIALRFCANLMQDEIVGKRDLSGIGGIETWKDAAEFLALGCKTIQVTTAIMQYGYRIVEDMISGLSHFMDERGYDNLDQFIGCALPNIIPAEELNRDFRLLPKFDDKKCVGCGRCYVSCYDAAHQAIDWNEKKRRPELNDNCVGCHLCLNVCPVQGCITPGEIQWKEGRQPVDIKFKKEYI